MFTPDSDRVYIVHVHYQRGESPFETVAYGDKLDEVIGDLRYKYMFFNKIVIYDAKTKEAVDVIRA